MILTRLLFVLTISAALALGATVLVSSWSDQLHIDNIIVQRTLYLVANDKIVCRTAVVCSLGLLATAWIFFRSPKTHHWDETPEPEPEFVDVEPKPEKRRKPPPGTVAGA